MYRVPADEVSVVVQGPIDRSSILNIKKTCDALPGAEIIVSTWSSYESVIGELEPLERINVVLTEDLEPLYVDPWGGKADNLLLQVTSTARGLAKATRPYVLKFRTDLVLHSPAMLVIERARGPDLSEKKITVTNFGFVDPAKLPYLGYFPDMVMFAKADQLRDYWREDIQYSYEFSLAQFLMAKLNFNNSGFRVCRYGCEQQLAMNYLKGRDGFTKLRHLDSVNRDASFFYEKAASELFYMIDYTSAGIKFPDRFSNSKYRKTFYSIDQFRALEEVTRTPSAYKKRYRKIWKRKYIGTFLTGYYYRGVIVILVLMLARLFDVPRTVMGKKVNKND